MGDGFCSRDLSVASGAGLRYLGRSGVVRIVTADAGLQGIVERLDHLREAGGSRGQVFVAVKTGGAPLARDQRFDLEVVGVFVRRAMTDFAREGAVVRSPLGFALFFVTLHTDLPAGVLDGLVGDDVDYVGPIVPDLAE
jgi:ABC-type tungstate transport system permease subunit